MPSKLQKKPKSKIRKKGYINIYSKLTAQEVRQIFFKTLYKKENPNWDDSLVYLAKKLKEYLQTNTKLLDVGCGNGNYLIDENRKEIIWAVGIDNVKDAVGKNICLDEIVIGDIKSIPFGVNSFDVVVSLWVLEHIDNPKLLFSGIHRVLKPKGKFIFATPNINFLPLRFFKIISWVHLNNKLNNWLFGRKKEDIFKTYYKANSMEKIRKLVGEKFKIIELRTNYDPSYTSFNLITYRLSNFLNGFCERLGLDITHPHIIGILEKK